MAAGDVILPPGRFLVPAGMAAGKVPVTDASGNIAWTSIGKAAGNIADGGETEYAFSSYKDVFTVASVGSGLTAQEYILEMNNIYTVGQATSGRAARPFDPTHYPGGANRTLRARLFVSILRNTVEPNVDWTFNLKRVTGVAGASAAAPTITSGTLGGSLVALTIDGTPTLPLSGLAIDVTADVALVIAGLYVATVVPSATMAAGSQVDITARLQVRQT